MSMPRRDSATCPKCGHNVPFTMWYSINTNEKNAAERIISGDLFSIECPECGFKSFVDYPFLFNDMVHHYFFWYCHPDGVDEALKSFQLRGIKEDPDVRCRVSTDLYKMREKIAVINAGYDDRIIELLKYLAKPELEKKTGKALDKLLFVPNDGDPHYELVIGDQVSHIRAAMEAYDYVKATYERYFDSFDKKAYFVDEQWAEEFFNYYNSQVKSDDDISNTSAQTELPHAEETPPSEEKLFCRMCGVRLPLDSKFCYKCGAEVVSIVVNIEAIKKQLDKLKSEICEIEKDLMLSVTDPVVINKAENDGLTPAQYKEFSRLLRNNKQHEIQRIIEENDLDRVFDKPIIGCFNSPSIDEIMSSRGFEEAFSSLNDDCKESIFLQPDRKLDAARVIYSLTQLVGPIGNDSDFFAIYNIAYENRILACRSFDETVRAIKHKLPSMYDNDPYRIIAFTEIRFNEASFGFYIRTQQDADQTIKKASDSKKVVEAQRKAGSLPRNNISL